MPDKCKCGAVFANEPSHFHSCKLNRKVGTYKRHNAVARVIKEVSDELGIPCQWNPRLEDVKGNRTMPDLLMHAHDGDIEIDVSICSVWCKTNRALIDPIGTREQSKCRKYEATRAANGHHFIPAVCDSRGQLGSGMLQIIGLLDSHHHNTSTSHTVNPKFREELIRALVIQLHDGNALVDITGLQYYPASRHVTRLPHPSRPHRPPPPPIPHDTLCRQLASADDIPSIRGSSPLSLLAPSSSSSLSLSHRIAIADQLRESKDEYRRGASRSSNSSSSSSSNSSSSNSKDSNSNVIDIIMESDAKRSGPAASSSSSFSSPSSSSPKLTSSRARSSSTPHFARRSRPIGDLPHKDNLLSSSIVDLPAVSSSSLSSLSSAAAPAVAAAATSASWHVPVLPRLLPLMVSILVPCARPPPSPPNDYLCAARFARDVSCKPFLFKKKVTEAVVTFLTISCVGTILILNRKPVDPNSYCGNS